MAQIISIQDGIEYKDKLSFLAHELNRGALAIIPTETVYGIACSVKAGPDTLSNMFSVKQRPLHKTIPWLFESEEAVRAYTCNHSLYAQELMRACWPGALTLILEAQPGVPAIYCGAKHSLACRVPSIEFVRLLSHECGCPLAVSSANISGMSPALSAEQIDERLVQVIDYIVDINVQSTHIPSTIISCTETIPRLVRSGCIPLHRITTFSSLYVHTSA